MSGQWLRSLFVIAGFYDGVLGLVFALAPGWAFERFQVVPPNHLGYVRFPGLLLLIFAALFFHISCDPRRYRMLIPYGIALKVAYCGTVFAYAATRGVPGMWLPWAWADLVFLILFAVAWRQTRTPVASST